MNAGGGIEPGAELIPNGRGVVALVKYGWERASAADMRSVGSNFRRRSSRSIAVRAASKV